MNTNQGRTLASLRSVPRFLDEHRDKLGDIVDCGQRKKLDAIVVALEDQVGTQSGSSLASKGATQKHQSLRAALIADMAKIAAIAAAELPLVPELEVLKMPKGSPSSERLRSAALGMAKAAAPYADVFVKAALPGDFIDRLIAAANVTVETVGARTQNRAAASGATKGLRATLGSGRKCVKALDTLVRDALKDDPALLAAWRTAKRVERFTGATAPVAALPIQAPKAVAAVPATGMTLPQTSSAPTVAAA